jgi:hypothetical protein
MRGVESFIAQSPLSERPMLAYNIKHGPEDQAPLVENLKHDVPAVRQATIEAIGSIPELRSSATPAVRLLLKDSDRQVRETARHFVGSGAESATSGKE